MRGVLVLSAALCLAGCTESDWMHVVPADSQAAYAPSAPSAAAAANYATFATAPRAMSPEEKCTRVATERRNDAASQGYEDEVQQQVYDKTYADCTSWATRDVKR